MDTVRRRIAAPLRAGEESPTKTVAMATEANGVRELVKGTASPAASDAFAAPTAAPAPDKNASAQATAVLDHDICKGDTVQESEAKGSPPRSGSQDGAAIVPNDNGASPQAARKSTPSRSKRKRESSQSAKKRRAKEREEEAARAAEEEAEKHRSMLERMVERFVQWDNRSALDRRVRLLARFRRSVVDNVCGICREGDCDAVCRDCTAHLHARCCGESPEKVRAINADREWRCPSCRVCNACGEPLGPRGVRCQVTGRMFHQACVDLESSGDGSGWVAPSARRCISCGCGATIGDKRLWYRENTMCETCLPQFDADKYCPECLRVWYDDDMDPMLECEVCGWWVHIECEGISESEYEEFNENEMRTFVCRQCRSHDDAMERVRASKQREAEQAAREQLEDEKRRRTRLHKNIYRQIDIEELRRVPRRAEAFLRRLLRNPAINDVNRLLDNAPPAELAVTASDCLTALQELQNEFGKAPEPTDLEAIRDLFRRFSALTEWIASAGGDTELEFTQVRDVLRQFDGFWGSSRFTSFLEAADRETALLAKPLPTEQELVQSILDGTNVDAFVDAAESPPSAEAAANEPAATDGAAESRAEPEQTAAKESEVVPRETSRCSDGAETGRDLDELSAPEHVARAIVESAIRRAMCAGDPAVHEAESKREDVDVDVDVDEADLDDEMWEDMLFESLEQLPSRPRASRFSASTSTQTALDTDTECVDVSTEALANAWKALVSDTAPDVRWAHAAPPPPPQIQAVLPLLVGGTKVLAFGAPDPYVRSSFASGHLVPLGYRAETAFWSARDPKKLVVYDCKVSCCNDVPVYVATAQDGSGEYVGESPMAVWTAVVEAVNRALGDDGAGAFGLARVRPMTEEVALILHGSSQRIVRTAAETFPVTALCAPYAFRYMPRTSVALDLPLRAGCARAAGIRKRAPKRRSAASGDDDGADRGEPRIRRTRFASAATDPPPGGKAAAGLPLTVQYRRIRTGAAPKYEVKQSSIHAWGLFASRDIQPNEMIIEYAGEVIGPLVAEKRERLYDEQGLGTYMFRIDETLIVDATKRGNRARFINHSCSPNCYSRILNVDGQKIIAIVAGAFVAKGHEFTYDYKFPFEEAKIQCNCGAPNCRGFMN